MYLPSHSATTSLPLDCLGGVCGSETPRDTQERVSLSQIALTQGDQACSWFVTWARTFFLRLLPIQVTLALLSGMASAQDMTPAKGAIVLSKGEYLRIPIAPEPVAGKLPDSATLENLFPRARNQGRLYSCTAWAATYSKAYRIFLASGRQGEPDDYLQSPAFVYSALTNDKCDKGTAIPLALRFLKSVGSVSWNNLPYSDGNCPAWHDSRQFARHNSFMAYRLSDDPDRALLSIRNLIVGGSPVIAAINACSEFDKPSLGHVTSVASSEVACGGHAILVVGFDDRQHAVRVLNSWGESWGDQGRAWVDYAVFKKRLLEAYVDFGPGEAAFDDASWLNESTTVASAPQAAPVVTKDVLIRALRSNIDPKILAKFPPVEGEAVNVSIWSIWLNLPAEYASQIRSVDYYFLHKTFKHNPQRSIVGSSVFLAQWRGYGCVDDAYLIARLADGNSVRADFNFCDVSKAERPRPHEY